MGILPITDPRMTRFWITLDQSVYFVLMSLARAKGGEIFIPRIPSMKITDLAKAIAPDCRQEIVGIRPGEKLHETLIGEDEARSAVRFKECYIVQPHLPSQRDLLKGNGDGSKGQLCPEGFKYTSDTNKEWLTVKDLKSLVDHISDDYAIEHSRWSMEDVPQ